MLFTPLFLLALCVSTVKAITFGENDGDSHPYVGTLLFVQNGGFYSCSGTLLSSTVMLTAGHCVQDNGNSNDVTYVRFDEDAFEGIGDFGTLQDWLDDRWILADNVIAHPQWDDFSEFPEIFDVGVVILSEPIEGLGFGSLPDLDLLEETKDKQGNKDNWWTVVGYGAQGVINPFAEDDYARYQATTRLIELKSHFTGSGTAKFTNNPGKGGGGSCVGDSGGPVFYQDSNVVGAVVSWGITPCIGVDYHFRMDTAIAHDFVGPFLD